MNIKHVPRGLAEMEEAMEDTNSSSNKIKVFHCILISFASPPPFLFFFPLAMVGYGKVPTLFIDTRKVGRVGEKDEKEYLSTNPM